MCSIEQSSTSEGSLPATQGMCSIEQPPGNKMQPARNTGHVQHRAVARQQEAALHRGAAKGYASGSLPGWKP
jgi:hypothetical protein